MSRPLRTLIERLQPQWKLQMDNGCPGVSLPERILNNSPQASRDWAYYYLSPSAKLSQCPRTGITLRHHIHKNTIQKKFKQALLIPSSDEKETNAEVILLNGKARRRSGAGTMTEEKRSHLEESPGTFAYREAHFHTS